MESLRAPRRERSADTWGPPHTEFTHQRVATPIYNALVREWGDAGRTVPATTAPAAAGRRRRTS